MFLLLISVLSSFTRAASGVGLHIPHVELGTFPTPVEQLRMLEKQIDCGALYIKRDDLSGKKLIDGSYLYGGNKVRKLEFLLADAMQRHARTIITYGCAGSNHALATAVYAHALGLKTILMLKDQPNSPVVRHNLLRNLQYEAQIQWYPDTITRDAATADLLQQDPYAYLIPTGGSNSVGSLGFVHAAWELAEQIQTGHMPEPDFIYLPAGSCGTVAGLLLGMQVAGIRSQLVGVTVEPEEPDAILLKIKQLFQETNKNLHALDASLPIFEFPAHQLTLNNKFEGPEYGALIPQAAQAIALMQKTEQITLEGTYSGKAFAALLSDAAAGKLHGKTVLFWNTYCGIDFSERCDENSYKKLPVEFHRYFEE